MFLRRIPLPLYDCHDFYGLPVATQCKETPNILPRPITERAQLTDMNTMSDTRAWPQGTANLVPSVRLVPIIQEVNGKAQ